MALEYRTVAAHRLRREASFASRIPRRSITSTVYWKRYAGSFPHLTLTISAPKMGAERGRRIGDEVGPQRCVDAAARMAGEGEESQCGTSARLAAKASPSPPRRERQGPVASAAGG